MAVLLDKASNISRDEYFVRKETIINNFLT